MIGHLQTAITSGSDPAHYGSAAATIVETIFGESTSPDVLLLVTSILLWLGYLGLRISSRLRVPLVTSFLFMGVASGPSGLNLLSQPILDALRVIEPVALGLITFSAGEQLVLRDVVGLARRNMLGVGLETLLPLVLVATAIFAVSGRLELALPLGAIAGTTGIATVVATLKEKGARGSYTRLLSVAIATDNVFAILAFSALLPIAMALEHAGGIGSLYLRSLASIVFSVLAGGGAGALLARYIGRIRSSSELSMFVLAHLLLTVAVVDIVGGSVLLAGLTMGIVAVNLSGDYREREWLFTSLAPLEAPLIAVFFLWAGAGLHITALADVGLLALAYLVARAIGKWFGPRLAALGLERENREAWELRALGYGLMPQAGAAIGLGILARDSLPVAGNEILTIVLGAVVVFELTGPLAVSRAVTAAGEATEAAEGGPMTLTEAVRQLEERKGLLMAVTDPTTSLWQLANVLNLARRLQTDVLLMPTEEPPSARRNAESGASRDPVELLQNYGDGHDQNVTVLPECSGDIAAGILHAVAEHRVDLLILAWGPYRRRLAPRVVEGASCPVVELPSPGTPRRADVTGLAGTARRWMDGGLGAVAGRLLGGRRTSRGNLTTVPLERDGPHDDLDDPEPPPEEGG
ncbi:MAG: cation:proton antiporter domain-containing protein [Thermoleophilia bacterium]